jgi:hypothetical protein
MSAPVHKWTRAEYDAHVTRVRAAQTDARAGRLIACGDCGRRLRLLDLFRCYHCGAYICPACAPGHFGPRPAALHAATAAADAGGEG